MESIFYVYIIFKRDKTLLAKRNNIIYIGKGCGRRWSTSLRRVQKKFSEKLLLTIIPNLLEREALKLESQLIKKVGVDNLYNLKESSQKGKSSGYGKRVFQFNFDGNLIAEFNTARDAERKYNPSQPTASGIARACRKNLTAYGYFWVYNKSDITISIKKRTNYINLLKSYNRRRMKKVEMTNLVTEEKTVFRSLNQAARFIGVLSGAVSNSVKSGGVVKKRYTFKLI